MFYDSHFRTLNTSATCSTQHETWRCNTNPSRCYKFLCYSPFCAIPPMLFYAIIPYLQVFYAIPYFYYAATSFVPTLLLWSGLQAFVRVIAQMVTHPASSMVPNVVK
ncbi:hypothetical protein M8J77_006428 [Diaphorina citri]|nr:hypothetical protein M8J77_006428 [Diaphorina citri]